MADLKRLPSVDRLKRSPGLAAYDERTRTRAARQAIEEARAAIASGSNGSIPDTEAMAIAAAATIGRRLPRPAINMSGVVLHTGLGRARLAPEAARAIAEVAESHALVEFDQETGRRGDRQDAVRDLLRDLTGCEDALVVNNCAAAVLLSLSALCSGREVVLSRGQMVEIGGAFRMPDIVEQSGCRLVEAGCTNKTRLSDYQAALGEETAAILRCHPSNFKIVGFHESPAARELAELAHASGGVLIDDVGSGCLVDTLRYGLPKERTLSEAVADGADVVTASGDKLLGGPQAGLILGTGEAIQRIKVHPLARVCRVDKLTLAGLEATLRMYADGRERDVPVWRYLARDIASVKRDATRIAASLPGSRIDRGVTEIGGGSMPGAEVSTWRVGLAGTDPEAMAARLRSLPTPVIGYIELGTCWLDPRTAEPDEVSLVCRELKALKA